MSNVFVITFRSKEGSQVLDRLVFRVGTIVWPFADRIWRQLRGDAPIPDDLRPLMLLRPAMTAPTQKPPDLSKPSPPGWELQPIKEPLYALVEFTLETRSEVVAHSFYPLGDVFTPILATVLELYHQRRELLFGPGRYLYEVLILPVARVGKSKKESKAFSEGSFELPTLDDGGPLLDFERLEDSPLFPAAKKLPLFLVPGRIQVGETRFGQRAWQFLATTLPMPLDCEIGGYLVGGIGEGENGEETVTIHHAVPAELSAGDAHILLMSPESGSEIRRRIAAEWPGDELVGWYHTHVFSAKNDALSGLSSIDEKTHDEQFTRSWQLAVLVNIWREAGIVTRQVRVFRRDAKGKLVDVDYSVVDE